MSTAAVDYQPRARCGRRPHVLPARKCVGCGDMFERKRHPGGELEGADIFRNRRFCSVDCYWGRPSTSQPTLHAEGCGGCETCLTVTPGPEPMARYSVACDCGIVLSAEDATSSDPWAEVIGRFRAHAGDVHRMGEDAAHDAAIAAWNLRGRKVVTEWAADGPAERSA